MPKTLPIADPTNYSIGGATATASLPLRVTAINSHGRRECRNSAARQRRVAARGPRHGRITDTNPGSVP